jgi:hypothetical protein
VAQNEPVEGILKPSIGHLFEQYSIYYHVCTSFLYVRMVILLRISALILIGKNGRCGDFVDFYKMLLFCDSCVVFVSVLALTIQRLTDLFSLHLHVSILLYLLWFFFKGILATIFCLNIAIEPCPSTKVLINKVNLFVKQAITLFKTKEAFTSKTFFVFIDNSFSISSRAPKVKGDVGGQLE